MNIGIIGSGMIGGTAARLFAGCGHQIALSNSRGPDALAALVQELGPAVKATTVEEAANFAEVVLLAIPLKAYSALQSGLLDGKIGIDAMNYYPQRDGTLDFTDHSSSEAVAKHFSGSRIVKAFNTIYFKNLAEQGNRAISPDERPAIFIAGDDPEAKALVASLIDQIGFSAVDTGNLREGSRRQEPGSAVYGQALTAAQARLLLAQE